MVLLAVLAGGLIADSVSNAVAVKTPINTGNLGCTDMEPLWLMAQSVPSASQVPCVRELPTGWLIAQVATAWFTYAADRTPMWVMRQARSASPEATTK